MRRVGEAAPEAVVRKFVAGLAARGIEAEAREDGEAVYAAWVYDEDRLDEAGALWHRFRSDPDSAEFKAVPAAAPADAAGAPQRPRAPRARGGGLRRALPVGGQGTVTLTMIAVSVGVWVLIDLLGARWLHGLLSFSNYPGTSFPELRDGQVWRLVTPAFMHGGGLHLLFNMMWLYQLGNDIERAERGWYLALFVGTSAVVCHVAQYLVSGTGFVGMSGVVYGLLGYTWVMTRYDSRFGYALSPGTMAFMLVWLVACLFGIFGPIANTEHIAGLIFGLVWGFLRSGFWRSAARRRRWRREQGH